MSGSSIYSVSEIVGTSTESMEKAVENAVAEAAKTLRHLAWFETTSVRGHIENGAIAHWQVSVKLGFRHEP